MRRLWRKRIAVSGWETGISRPVIYVLCTGDRTTKHAVETALKLSRDLETELRLLAVETVPYSLPLDQPHVCHATSVDRLERLVAGIDAAVSIEICYARSRMEAWQHSLPPHSVVVLGSNPFFWFQHRERKWTRLLERKGHEVIVCRAPRTKNLLSKLVMKAGCLFAGLHTHESNSGGKASHSRLRRVPQDGR